MELKIKQLSKKFKKEKVIDHIDVTLHEGIHALLGANGSGKTTLIRMLVGTLPVSEGQILWEGQSIYEQYDLFCSQLGYLPQNFGYYPNYTVNEFLEYMCIVKQIPMEEWSDRIQSLLKRLNLEQQQNKKMKHLSGGMLRRVGIAQALLNRPKLLILDEPTAGLDPKERMILRKLISVFAKECMILISTHIVSDIETIADDILVLKNGTLMRYDTCENLLLEMQGKVWEIKLNEDEIESMEDYKIVKLHHKNGMEELRVLCEEKPHQLAIEVEPNLDDFYLYHFYEESETNVSVD